MRLLFIAAIAFLLAPAMARAESWRTCSPESQGMSSQELAGLVTFGTGNGFDSMLVARRGCIVAEAYYGPFAAGMKHRINSVTKSVIGSLVGIALKDRLLTSADQPVLDFFPDGQFANVDERKKALTLRHLLDMTSGLDWNEPLNSSFPASFLEMERSADWVRFILDRPMVREPGASFDYNSGNTHVLSAILSKATGRNAEAYAREKLFGPLGIEDVHWRRDPQGVTAGGAGLYLQPRDMARLGQLWLHDGVWEGRRLLPQGWIGQVRNASISTERATEWRYANLLWSSPVRGVFMAVGYNRQYIVVMPEMDVVAVFTGGLRYSTTTGIPSIPRYQGSAVLDPLKAAVKSDTALAEDPAAGGFLADAVKQAAEQPRTQSAALSPLAAAISGKVYRLQPNRLQTSTVSFTFENGAAAYTYDVDGQRFGGPVGLDGLFRVGGRRLHGPSAAKGLWRDDRTYTLELQTLGNDDVTIATFTFDGRTITGRVATSPGSVVDLKGEADE